MGCRRNRPSAGAESGAAVAARRSRRIIRGLGLELRDGRRSQAVCELELNEDERAWLEAHGIDAG